MWTPTASIIRRQKLTIYIDKDLTVPINYFVLKNNVKSTERHNKCRRYIIFEVDAFDEKLERGFVSGQIFGDNAICVTVAFTRARFTRKPRLALAIFVETFTWRNSTRVPARRWSFSYYFLFDIFTLLSTAGVTNHVSYSHGINNFHVNHLDIYTCRHFWEMWLKFEIFIISIFVILQNFACRRKSIHSEILDQQSRSSIRSGL